MTKVLDAVQSFAVCVAVALGGLGLFCGLEQSARAELVTTNPEIGQCQPTDKTKGVEPCYDVYMKACDNAGKAYTCVPSGNLSQCTCGY